MRIGIFDPYLDDLGGGEKYMMTVASCLSRKHDVTVFWDNYEDFNAIKNRFNISLENIKLQKNIFSPNLNFLQKTKAFGEYDAFIILSDGSIPFVFPKKLYMHIQQPLPNKKGFNFKDNLKRRHISAIFYNSKFTKHFNDRFFPSVKAEVIYPPVKLDLSLKIEDLRKENVIMHVGRFRVRNLATDDYKKQGFMIESFKKIVDDGLKNWKFILASSVRKEDEETFEKLKNNAKDYPIEFYINKTNKEIFALYNKAKIYWHASGYGEDIEKHPELAEHFGMTTVEAMGAGVVPVVINSGGQKEIVTDGENGLLWNTREELFKKTEQITNDENLRIELAKNAIKRAKDFSEETFSQKIQGLITG